MIEKRRGHLESCKIVDTINNSFSECIVQIDFSEYTIFYNIQDLMELVNKDVIYTTRPDIVHGKQVEVIAEIALVTEVVSTEKVSIDTKLVPFDVKRPVCNFNINDIRFGEYKPGCIAILLDYEFGQSRKANWLDCNMLDAYGHLFSLRIFTTESDAESMNKYEVMKNGYVEFDIEATKYGYQTQILEALEQPVEKSPEIAIARDVVTRYIESDAVIHRMCNDLGFYDAVDNFADGELGYLWVRMASELYMIDTLDNITSGVPIQTLKRAVICSRLNVLPHRGKWNASVISVVKILKYDELRSDEALCSIVDIFYNGVKDHSARDIYLNIRNTVSNIINIRRGITDEEESNFIADCRSHFDGLL